MSTRWLLCTLIAVGSLGFLAGVGFSDDAPPSEAEMMKIMKEYATPGKPHKLLAAMVGDWDAASTSYMNPEKPEVTKGSATNKMALDGRYLHASFSGTWSGMPHKGEGFMGFDNHLKRYQNVWVDNFGTGMMLSQGEGGEDGTSINLSYVWDGPMGKMPGRMRYTITGKDSHKLEAWHSMGGKEMKSMEIVFTRKQKAAATDCPK